MAKRIGNQTPRIRVCPEYSYTYGDDAIYMGKSYGMALDPWQCNFMRDLFAHDENGKPICSLIGLDVPRQNGKNAALEVAELFAMAILGWRIIHTAHEVKTAREAFSRLCAYFENEEKYPELYKLAEKPGRPGYQDIRKANGQEAIYLHRRNPQTGEYEDWGSIQFSARTRGAARGFADIQMIVFDEGQEMTDEQLAALMPTLSASSTGTRQMIFTGTPTPPGSPGTVMSRTRQKVIDGETDNACWHSFSIEKLEEVSPDWDKTVDLIYATNPAMGIRLDIDFTKGEFTSAPPFQFAQERLNWWQSTEEEALISEKDWGECATTSPPLAESCNCSYGIKFDPSGYEVAIAVCAVPNDGTDPHVELIDVLPNDATSLINIAKIIESGRDRLASVIVDGNGSKPLLLEMNKGGYSIPKRSYRAARVYEVVAAAQMFKMNVDSHVLTWWNDDNQDRLKYSVLKSYRRKIGKEGWGFDGDDSTPVEAAALALYAAKTTKRNPNRKLRIG